MAERIDAIADAVKLLADAICKIEQYPEYAVRCAEDARDLVIDSKNWGKP